MHDYGTDGWRIYGQADTLLGAVKLREEDLANAGGDCHIFAWLDPIEAYCSAHAQRGQRGPDGLYPSEAR